MTVPTPLLVLAGPLLIALILRLLLDRQKLLTVVMVSAAKHQIATPTELQVAFELLPP